MISSQFLAIVLSQLKLRLMLVAIAAAAVQNGRAAAAEPVYLLTAAATEDVVYVSDLRLPGLWRIEAGKQALFFQASSKFRTPLNAVRCVRLDRKSRVLACDSSTRDVYRFDEQGQPHGLTQGMIGIPMDVVETPNGELLVSDLETHRIWKIPSAGGDPVEFAAVPAPRGLCLDAEDRLLAISHGPNQVVRISADGTLQAIVQGRPFQFPHEIVSRKDGTLLISDGYAKAIWKVAPGSEPVRWIAGEPLQNPVGLCDRGEQLLIVDPRAKAVFQADADGKLTVFWNGTRE